MTSSDPHHLPYCLWAVSPTPETDAGAFPFPSERPFAEASWWPGRELGWDDPGMKERREYLVCIER